MVKNYLSVGGMYADNSIAVREPAASLCMLQGIQINADFF